MLTFKKDDLVKYVDEQSSLVPVLLKDGWKADGVSAPKAEDDNLAALREEAEALGIKVHHKTGAEKLAALIAEAKAAA